MTAAGPPRSILREHPFLAAYLVALLVVWLVSGATWTVGSAGTVELHPVAQALQYALVAVAATLAGLRLRVQPPQMRDGATFRFYDLHWSISDDVGGQAFWTAVGIGALAMLVNVVLLALVEVVLSGGGAGLGTYLEWMGAGIAAGAVIGMFSAFVALVMAAVVRRRRS